MTNDELRAHLVDRLMHHLQNTWDETSEIDEVLRLVRIRLERITSLKLLRAFQPDETM